jgi:hypothetical protein
MASLFDPSYPSMLQGGGPTLDPNKPALLQGRGGVEAAQKALEAQRLLELERMAAQGKAALTSGGPRGPTSAAWTAGQALDGWGASRGLMDALKGAGKALGGPVAGGLQALTYSGDVGEGSELSPSQREAKNPGEQADAQAYARRIQDNAKDAVRTARGDPILSPEDPGNVAAAVEAQEAVSAPPVERTPVGPVAEKDPVTVEQAAAATAQQRESQRQTVELGAQEALKTNQVTRPQLAREIVSADAQRAGKELTPEQSKAAVAEELGVMKGMDNNDLSKYVSYALIAGGIAASFLDKSGRAGDMFAASFNKQLDRNLALGIQNKKQQAAAAKQAQDLQIALMKAQEASRTNDIREKSVDQTGRYQEGQLDVAQDRTEIQRGTLGLGYAKENRQAAQGAAGLGLRAQALELQRELGTRNMDLKEEANTIKAAGAALKAAKGEPGVALTEKGSNKVVSDFAKQQGLNLDSGAKSALASQVQQASKNDPEWAKNPAKVMTKILQSGGYTKEADPGIPFIPFTGGGSRIKQKKYQ